MLDPHCSVRAIRPSGGGGLPDIRGREQITKVHMRKVPVADDVDASIIARGTPGFSGADLANLVNEAALFAARGGKAPGEHGRIRQSERQNYDGCRAQIHGYVGKREAQHVITKQVTPLWVLMPDHDPVYKVTIIPRGRALGVTMFLPEEDRYSMSCAGNTLSNLQPIWRPYCRGDHAWQRPRYDGGSNDIERATQLARSMVTKWASPKTRPADV